MLSFEKIRELERAEHESKELVKLPENFYHELDDYISRKEKIADEREIKNIKNTIKRLFEMREKKLLDAVIYSLRTGLHAENLTKKEETVFSNILSEMNNYRKNLFFSRAKEAQQPAKEKSEKPRTLYRVKKAIKPFIGPDMKLYELKENDIVNISTMPKPLNDLLLKEGVIERMEK